jgi:hypothetical protein
MLLIAGGTLDPHMRCFVDAVRQRGLPAIEALSGADHVPALSWALDTDRLELDGRVVEPTAVFHRYNVFSTSSDAPDAPGSAASFRAQAWYAAWQGWVACHPNVRAFNHRHGSTTKPHQLVLAKRAGLSVPATLIANAVGATDSAQRDELIAKPVAGGGYAHTLRDALAGFPDGASVLPAPAIIQARLVPPETRVFVVGPRLFAFDIAADTLDYREAAETRVTAVPVPPSIGPPLLALARTLGLDFAAADFKADPATGAPVFLEINAQPMFARFDQAVDGALVEAMIDWLVASS